jgi:hypothetical protein
MTEPSKTDVGLELASLSTGLGILLIPLFPLALPGLVLVAAPLVLLGVAGAVLAAPLILPIWVARKVLRARRG